MLQCEYDRLLENLSWDRVAQTVVDNVGKALDTDIVILYSGNPQQNSEQYFIYQKLETEIQKIDRDLLKLTVRSIAELSEQKKAIVDCHEEKLSNELSGACLKANISSSISIPLFHREDLAASLTIHRCQQDSLWTKAEVRLAQRMANQTALTISQVLACEKARALIQREKTINRITATIRSSLEPPVMFAAIARELGETLRVDGCSLSLWTKDDEFVKCVGLYNPHEKEIIIRDSPNWQQATKSRVPIGENPILQALLFRKKPVLSQDLELQKKLARYELPWHSKARALLIVPLIVEDEIIGSITLRQSDCSRCWQESEIELAQMVADHAAIAISQVLAYEKVKTLAEREATVNRIATAIRSSLEPQIIFSAIAKELGRVLQVDGCSLSLWTKDDEFVKCVGLYNPHEKEIILRDSPDWEKATTSKVPIDKNPILQALLFRKKPVCSQDLERQKAVARYELPWHSKARALLIVPLIVEDEIIGSITLRQSDRSRCWKESEIELAEAVATQAAIAVKQAKLYDTAKQQAQQLQVKEQKVRDLNNYLTESILKRFLPESIVNKAAEGKLVLDLSPEPRRVTILFCDLVGFTNLSSQLGSRLLAEILDDYLEAMSKAVFDRGGTVDKFIGDAIMAMFGAPEELSRQEQAQRAIATARTMHTNLQQLNQKWQAKGMSYDGHVPTLKMRCGIHQGRAIVGMFGGGQRKDYTAIGKVVNIAARLQSVASPDNILVSERVANCLQDVEKGEVKLQQLKGLKENFRTFAIAID